MTLNILGVQYNVTEVPIVSRDEFRKGQIDYIKNEITIDESLPKESRDQVLMHEIIHAICDLQGLYDIGEDENKVQSLATALHQVFKDNAISF